MNLHLHLNLMICGAIAGGLLSLASFLAVFSEHAAKGGQRACGHDAETSR